MHTYPAHKSHTNKSQSAFGFDTRGAHVPDDKHRFLVQTPYGRALTRKTFADGMHELELMDWRGAVDTEKNVRPATLYSIQEFPSIEATVGDHVLTQYGRGKVTQIEGNQVKVTITSWRLAGRSLVRCFLQKDHIQLLRPPKIYEMTVFERVERAQELKVQASQYFAQKNYKKALELYATAIETVRYVQHGPQSTNEVRSDLLVVLVTCYNNAATCSVLLSEYDQAIKFTKNALVLLDAMRDKKDGKIHQILVREGFSDQKVFGEWKLKSLVVQARALAGQHDYDEALRVLQEEAPGILHEFEPESSRSIDNFCREIQRLTENLTAWRKHERKLEKRRAQAMFGSSSNGSKEPTKSQNGTSTTGSGDGAMNGNGLHAKPESLLRNGNGSTPASPQAKRRVSFSERVAIKEIEEIESEWYEDSEVLTGLAVFAVSAGVAAFVVGRLLSRG